MENLKLFIQITRLDRPIGYMLLFWPCLWGLTIAYDFERNLNIYFFYLILFFLGSVLMAIYIMFIRSGGVENTWGFFNLIFVQNLMAFLIGIYAIKISKLGHTDKTSIEGVIAPGVLTILSAILCYGLADKIYT